MLLTSTDFLFQMEFLHSILNQLYNKVMVKTEMKLNWNVHESNTMNRAKVLTQKHEFYRTQPPKIRWHSTCYVFISYYPTFQIDINRRLIHEFCKVKSIQIKAYLSSRVSALISRQFPWGFPQKEYYSLQLLSEEIFQR